MKKQMKQVAAATLAALCFGTVAIPTAVSAANITITDGLGNDIVAANHTVYQVFELDGNDAIVPSSLTDAVKAFFTSYIPSTDANAIGATDSNEVIADKIGQYLGALKTGQTSEGGVVDMADSDVLLMARKLAAALETAGTNKVTITTGEGGNTTVTDDTMVISGLDTGYYLVTGSSVDENGDKVVSSVVLETADQDITITTKVEKPSVEKKILEGTNEVDANVAAVGETVNYKINSAIPDVTYYASYYMKFTDTLSPGLDFVENEENVENSAIVTIGTTVLKADQYQLVISEDGRTMTIEITDVTLYGTTNAPITITYSATVNENANIDDGDGTTEASDGNPNKVKLTYSNDPNWDTDGDGWPDDEDPNPDTPDTPPTTPETPPTEDTPEDEVITYLTKFQILKTNQQKEKLEGAVFKIELVTTADNPATTETNEEVVADLYTAKFENGTVTLSTSSGDKVDGITIETDANGLVTLSGLAAGTYKITETEAPTDYILDETPRYVTIAADFDNAAESTKAPTWKYDGDTIDAGAVYQINVINNRGTNLPSTGGIGTTIFTIVGLTLMATAAGAFIIKRKVTAQ